MHVYAYVGLDISVYGEGKSVTLSAVCGQIVISIMNARAIDHYRFVLHARLIKRFPLFADSLVHANSRSCFAKLFVD